QVHNLEKAVPALAPQGQAHSLEKVGAQDPVRNLEMVVHVPRTMVQYQVPLAHRQKPTEISGASSSSLETH
ncbi:hypothetical protein Tco_0512978, partial [Tanacetum coccineum]